MILNAGTNHYFPGSVGQPFLKWTLSHTFSTFCRQPQSSPPVAFFGSYKNICTKYLWDNHRPRISYDLLSLPKQKGRIGLPNLKNYYHACHFSRIPDWSIHGKLKDWVEIEASFAQLPLNSLPWLPPIISQQNSAHIPQSDLPYVASVISVNPPPSRLYKVF